MPEEIRARVQRAIDAKTFPGCVVGVVRQEGEPVVRAFGNYTYESDSPRVTPYTVYDLASITKSIPTASLVATFVSEERLTLSDKVAQYIPELANDHEAGIEDLLRYRVHGPQLSKLSYRTFEEIRTHVFEHGFDGPPGESVYTNFPAFVLGIILERMTGKSIAALAHEYFFASLDMKDTSFFPSPSVCTPTEIDKRLPAMPAHAGQAGGEVRGLPHDESAYKFAIKRRSVGHAGLFSTAPDLLKFLSALLGGKFPHVVSAAQKGLGWQLHDPNFMGEHAEPHTFGKTGFTGTSVVCDMEWGIGFVILSNRTYPKRPENHDAINAFRRDIADILLQEM